MFVLLETRTESHHGRPWFCLLRLPGAKEYRQLASEDSGTKSLIEFEQWSLDQLNVFAGLYPNYELISAIFNNDIGLYRYQFLFKRPDH